MLIVHFSDNNFEETCLKRLKNFLMECRKTLASGSLWVAIQTDMLKDIGDGYAEDWKELNQTTNTRLRNVYHIT